MTQRERRGWIIVASLWVTLFVAFGGGYNTVPVFIPALVKHFGWGRAQVSLLPSVIALSNGLISPLVGRLLDRIEARLVMVVGVAAIGLAFLAASGMDSFAPMFAIYLLIGIGISAGTVVPAAFVGANWFEERRGLALGFIMSGTTVGAMTMTQVASHIIAYGGLRAGYIALGAPMLLLAIPAVLVFVRSRPPGAAKLTVAQAAEFLEGFEIAAVIRTRSFWLILFAQFAYFFCATGSVFHLIAYMVDLGYKAQTGAWVLSACFAFTSLSKIVLGLLADRTSGRVGLAVNFAFAASGTFLAFFLTNTAILFALPVIFGFSLGAPLMLIPVMVGESLGIKRFGSIMGLVSLGGTAGATLGPIAAGWIHDMTSTYTNAYELFLVINIVGLVASLACLPYKTELARMAGVLMPEPVAQVPKSG